MKRSLVFFILMLLTFFVSSHRVFAVQGVASFDGPAYSTGIRWSEFGTPGSESGDYKDHKKIMTINGQKYRAFCLDPGLTLNTGTTYNCNPTSDGGLISLLEQARSLDYTLAQLAIRIYAGMKLTGSSKLVSMKAAVFRFWQVKLGAGDIIANACAASGVTCSTDPYAYLSGNNALVDAAYNLAYTAFMSGGAGAGGGAGNISFTKLDSSTTSSINYKVSSLAPINKIKFVCEGGCTITSTAEFNTPANSWNLTVTPAPDCKPFKIKAYWAPSGAQICTKAGSGGSEDYQYLAVDFEDPTDPSLAISTTGDANYTFEDTGIGCNSTCCELDPIEQNHIEGNINNCCYDDTHSEAREYNLDDLFCKSEDLKVDKYFKKCNNEAYKESTMTGQLNDYCEIYCTERVTVDIPHAITATSGRYFELTKTPQGTKSPYVEGYKRCRTLVHFKNWHEDYMTQVKNEIEAYKEFQKNKLYEILYEEAMNKTETCTASITYDCKGQVVTKKLDATISGSTTIPGCEATADSTNWDHTETKTFTYTRYKFKEAAHLNASWYAPSLDPDGNIDSVGYYKYVKLKYIDQTGKATHRDYSVYPNPSDTIKGLDQYKTDYETHKETKTSTDGRCVAVAGVTCTRTFNAGTCGHSESDITSGIYEDMPGNKNAYASKAASAQANYTAAVTNAKTLEKQIDVCDKYFTDYQGKNAQANFPFQTDFFGFEYSQIYLSDFGNLNKEVVTVPFESDPGCVITGPYFGPDSEDGLSAPQYSTTYGDGDKKTQTKDFKAATLEYKNSTNGFQVYLDDDYDADQKFVYDAKYKAACSWNEPTNTKYTLMQKGIVVEVDTNTTKNDRQYSIHLTTLEGTYDTRWLISGFGTNAKFDAYFATHGQTCSPRQNPQSNGLLHCGLKVEYEIIKTGKCNGTKTTVDPDECDPPSQAESALTFKIVDPIQMFTCDSFDSCGYGYNWFKTTTGQNVLTEIKTRASTGRTYDPSRRTFSAVLEVRDMRHIKNYNRSRENNNYGGYSDFSLSCDCPSDPEECHPVGGTQTCKRTKSCTKCRSSFLNNLYSGTVRYNGTNHNVTAPGGSIEAIRDSGRVHWSS